MRSLSIGLLLAVVALAALGFLFKGYLDNNKAADAAAAQLSANKSSIALLDQQNKALESQIKDDQTKKADLEKALNDSQLLPDRLTSSTILRDVLNLCAGYNVTALPVSSSDWSAVQIQGRSYSVFKANFQLSGQQSDLHSCLQALQSQLYPTLVIENLSYSIPAPVQAAPLASPEASPSPVPAAPTALPVINISIAIYAK